MTASFLFAQPDYSTNYVGGYEYNYMEQKPQLIHNVQLCSACGERADGVHFGAIVCAACGAFFRRSVVDQRVYSCSGCASGSSPSTSRGWTRERDERAATRMPGICRYCRFQRCLAIGMKPEEVQAKRTHGSIRHRPLRFNSFGTNLDDLVHTRREISKNRPPPPSESTIFTVFDLRQSMRTEYEIFQSVIMHTPIMIDLLNDISLQSSTNAIEPCNRDTTRELFLFSFLFESIRSTALQGGIQCDSLTLPTGVRLPLDNGSLERFYSTDPNITDPACLARLSHDFLHSMVRIVARSMQSLHIDQHEIAWLYVIFISSAVTPIGRRSQFRDELLSLIAVGEEHAIERQGSLLLLLTPMMSSLNYLREFLSVAELSGASLCP